MREKYFSNIIKSEIKQKQEIMCEYLSDKKKNFIRMIDSNYTLCCSLRENTHSFAWKGDQQREDTFISAKKRTFAHKSDSITIFAF